MPKRTRKQNRPEPICFSGRKAAKRAANTKQLWAVMNSEGARIQLLTEQQLASQIRAGGIRAAAVIKGGLPVTSLTLQAWDDRTETDDYVFVGLLTEEEALQRVVEEVRAEEDPYGLRTSIYSSPRRIRDHYEVTVNARNIA